MFCVFANITFLPFNGKTFSRKSSGRVLLQGLVGPVQLTKVLFGQGDCLFLARRSLPLLPREVDIEVHLEGWDRGEFHELRGGILNEAEMFVLVVGNDYYESEMGGILEGLSPLGLRGSRI